MQLTDRVGELSASAGELRTKAAAASTRAEREASARQAAQEEVKALRKQLREAQYHRAAATDSQATRAPQRPPAMLGELQEEISALRQRLAEAEVLAERAEEARSAAEARAGARVQTMTAEARTNRQQLVALTDELEVSEADGVAQAGGEGGEGCRWSNCPFWRRSVPELSTQSLPSWSPFHLLTRSLQMAREQQKTAQRKLSSATRELQVGRIITLLSCTALIC